MWRWARSAASRIPPTPPAKVSAQPGVREGRAPPAGALRATRGVAVTPARRRARRCAGVRARPDPGPHGRPLPQTGCTPAVRPGKAAGATLPPLRRPHSFRPHCPRSGADYPNWDPGVSLPRAVVLGPSPSLSLGDRRFLPAFRGRAPLRRGGGAGTRSPERPDPVPGKDKPTTEALNQDPDWRRPRGESDSDVNWGTGVP